RNHITGFVSKEITDEVISIRADFVKSYEKVVNLPLIEEEEIERGIVEIDAINKAIADFTKIKMPKRIIDALTAKKKELSKAGKQDNKAQIADVKEQLLTQIEDVSGINVIAQKVELNDAGAVKDLAFQLKGQVENLFLVLGAEVNGKPSLTIVISEELSKTKDLHAGNIIREAAKEMRGGGGGQPFFATAGGSDVAGIEAAIAKAKNFIL
ncbi:MAG: hypothetical protein JKY30_02315, partial [Flavobacteriales bacterium]|nr:hypothetical protein [Flavobacteriales bacterium]